VAPTIQLFTTKRLATVFGRWCISRSRSHPDAAGKAHRAPTVNHPLQAFGSIARAELGHTSRCAMQRC